MRALLKVVVWSFAVAGVVLAVALAAAAGWLPPESALSWMLGVLVVGGVALGSWLGRGLFRSQPPEDKSAEPDPATGA
jgi:hypothetical protein